LHARLRRRALLLPVVGLARPAARRLSSGPIVGAAAFLLARLAQAAPAALTASREIDLADFDRLVLQVPAEVTVVLADRTHARIEAEPKVIDSIAFSNSKGIMRVTVVRGFDTRQPIRIHVSCRRLVALEARSSVDVDLDGLRGERLLLKAADSSSVSLRGLNLESIEVDMEGSATVTAEGSARRQKVHADGAGDYDASKLASREAVVEATGSSDVLIDSRDSLQATVSGAATVGYAGNPRLKQAVDGAGTLKRR
jgi:hypothetical protein